VTLHGSRAVDDSERGSKSPTDSRSRADRRKEPRHSVDTSVVVRLVDVASKLEGRIVDLSMGGCRIRTNLPFPLGVFRRVETQFRMNGLPFRLAGVTQAIYDPFQVGIRFLNLSERMREQLKELIEEIKGQSETSGTEPAEKRF